MNAKLFFISFLLLVSTCYAQDNHHVFHPSKSLDHYNLDQWTGETGLNSNNLTGVVQDELGYLWISSYNGLLRFDGQDFTLFDAGKIDFLETESISRSYYDHKDGFLFTTQGSGIIQLKEGKLSTFFSPEILPTKSIRTVWKENDNSYWIGTNNLGVFIIENNQVSPIDHPALNNISIYQIAAGKDDEVWVATNGKGLVHLKGREVIKVYTVDDGLKSNRVNTIHYSSRHGVMAGTTDALGLLKEDSFLTLHQNWRVNVNLITEDQHHTLWVATERGLLRYNPEFDLNEWVGSQTSVAGLEITDLCFDKEGSLWLSSSKAGLFRIKETGIHTINTIDGLRNRLINIVSEDGKGNIYIGNDEGEIDIFSQGKICPLTLDNPLTNLRIRDIAHDPDGNTWIATYNGLLKKSKTGEKILDMQTANFPSTDLRRILVKENNIIWVASRSGGAFRLSHEMTDKYFKHPSSLKSNYVLAMEEDRKGNIYLGTHSGGLSIINTKDEVATFSLREGDDSGILIFNIHIDDNNRVFLVTNTGLYYFDGSKFLKLNLSSESKGETFFDWVEDHNGHVWITGNKGILRINKNEIVQYIKTPNKHIIDHQIFTNEDGMISNECTGATRALVSSDGKVWVPTINGVVVIKPEAIPKNKLIPLIDINQFNIDDTTYHLNLNHQPQRIQVKAGNLRYTFQFTVLSLFAPSKNKFKYQLAGFDKDWISTDNNRTVEYTNLEPGEYTFRVIGSNNDGLWNEQGIAFQFEVLPFYYQTVTFKIGLILFSVILVMAFVKWRTNNIQNQNRKLSKLNAELDRFVYSASHDLRAPLTSILGLVYLMKKEKKKNNEYLDLIEQSIKRLDNFISDIINFSRNARLELIPEAIDFQKAISDVFSYVAYLDQNNKIKKNIDIKGHGDFYTDKTRLDIILNNLISNAVKYHNLAQDQPYINVRITFSEKTLHISIEDNGQGIRPEHQKNIFKMFYRANHDNKGSGLGLYIVFETVQKLGGKITFSSTYGKGSTFTLTLNSLPK